MGKRTPLYALHVKANAKIVDFAGWDMPLHYGSQLEEHHYVRKQVGMFDVSHMGVVDIKGTDSAAYLRKLLANNVDRLANGKALYTCMLNEQACVIDDLIVYKVEDNFYRLVINAGTREKDVQWMRSHSNAFNLTITERTDLAMIAVQGPKATAALNQLLPANQHATLMALKPFTFMQEQNWFIARTGYTGEDGYEIILPANETEQCWQALQNAGVQPCGLGARDTLRLEAGLNLYGADMNDQVTPYESNLGWTVALDPVERDFIGRNILEQQKHHGVQQHLVGLVLTGPGVIRNHQKVFITGDGQGEVTSGGYSPTLEKSIALARLPINAKVGAECLVEIRNKQVPAMIVKPPFVKQGQKLV